MVFQQSLKRGYSLIELMMYVAIVGILLVGAATAINSALKKGRKSATTTSLRVISQEIDSYYADNSRYPETLEDLMVKPEGMKGNGEWPYVKPVNGEMPKDGYDYDFHYERTPGQPHPYELYSYGPNGEDAPQEEWISAW